MKANKLFAALVAVALGANLVPGTIFAEDAVDVPLLPAEQSEVALEVQNAAEPMEMQTGAAAAAAPGSAFFDSAKKLYTIYDDSFGSPVRAGVDKPAAVRNQRAFAYDGTTALKVNMEHASMAEGVFNLSLADGQYFKDVDRLVSLAVEDENAYFGFWFYREAGTAGAVSLIVDGETYPVVEKAPGNWQFVYANISGETQTVAFRATGDSYYLDAVGIYMELPEAPAPAVTPVYYGMDGMQADTQNVYGYFDIGFNYVMNPEADVKVVLEQNGAALAVDAVWQDAKTLRVKAQNSLAFETEYVVTVTGIQNIYGGTLEETSFTFRTQPAPVRFTGTETVEQGLVNSAEINGTLSNEMGKDITFTLYVQAETKGQAIAVAGYDAEIPAGGVVDVNGLALEFDAVDAADLQFSYFLLDGSMMPVNNMVEKPQISASVDSVDILGNTLTVSGAFGAAEGDRSVTVAAVPKGSGIFPGEIVLLMEGKSGPDGAFVVSGSLYNGLSSGDYTVYVWTEGSEAGREFPVYYSSRGDREKILAVLLNGSAEEVAACIKNPEYTDVLNTLGLLAPKFAELETASQESVAEMVVAAAGKTEGNIAELVNAAIVLQLLNDTTEHRGVVLREYASYFNLSDAALALLLDAAEDTEGLTALLGTKQFKQTDDLNKLLTGVDMVLLALRAVDNQERLHALMVEHRSLLRFDADALLAEHEIAAEHIPEIFTALLGKAYATAADVEYQFNKAMYAFIEGPPYGAVLLRTIYGDGINGGYIGKWNGSFATTDVEDRVKVGAKALYVNPVSGDSMGVLFQDKTLANDEATKASLMYGTAYIGMWVYIPSNAGWFELKMGTAANVEHSTIQTNGVKRDCWQYVFTKVEQDVQSIIVKTSSPTGFWIDDVKVYALEPDDPAAAVEHVQFYDWGQKVTSSQNQYVNSYFDVVYNFPTELSRVDDVAVKNAATGETVLADLSVVDHTVLRIHPKAELEYDTEYTVTIGTYENVFGGRLDGYTFTFKTCLYPYRFENVETQKGDASASLTGTLYNDNPDVKTLYVFLLARAAGETAGVAHTALDYTASIKQNVNLQVAFPETDSNAVSLSYYIVNEAMLPISVVVPQADSAVALEQAGIVRKDVQIRGSFADCLPRAVVAAVAKGKLAQFDPAAVVAMMETVSDSEGRFALSDVLYDGLDTGDYTIFVWGEGAEAVTIPAYYAGKDDRDSVFGVLSRGGAQDIEALLDHAEQHKVLQAMGMLVAEYNALGASKTDVAAAVAAAPAGSKDTEADAIGELNAAVVIASIKAAPEPVEVLVPYAAYINVSNKSLALIQSIMEDHRKADVNSLIKAAGFTNAAELNRVLEEQLLLAAINSINSNNHLKMKDLLAQYKTDVGFDAAALIKANGVSAYNEMQLYQGMIGRNFATLGDCSARFYSLLSQYRPASGGNSPGGNGSGGNRDTGTVGVPIVIPTVKEPGNAEPVFTDISGHWAQQSITYLYEKGIVKGKDGTQFCPNDTITREEFVQMLLPALGLADDTAEAAFTDVAAGRWSYPVIAAAYKHGIVSGYPDGSFGAAACITREDMAVMIYRALDVSGRQLTAAPEGTFADDAQIAEYAQAAVQQLHQAGIVNGMGDNQFLPKNNATRAEAAQMVYSLMR